MTFPHGNPFAQMLHVEKKWDLPATRTTTTWVERYRSRTSGTQTI